MNKSASDILNLHKPNSASKMIDVSETLFENELNNEFVKEKSHSFIEIVKEEKNEEVKDDRIESNLDKNETKSIFEMIEERKHNEKK